MKLLRGFLVLCGLGAAGLCAAEAPPITFHVASGKAQLTLRVFAEQAGVPVIYPAELVEDAQTRTVDGTYTPHDALDHMLVGTGLSTWQDERTGALAIGRAPRLAKPIELPPFVVEEPATTQWRYARAEGIEVLSRCRDEVTVELISQNYGLHALLETILPKSLRASSDLPTTYLFFSDGGQAAVSREILESLQRREVEFAVTQAAAHGRPAVTATFGAMPNYRFWDREALSIFFVWDEINNDRGRLMITPSYFRYLLEYRIPALPAWFVEGMTELYRSAIMNTAPVRSLGTPFETSSSSGAVPNAMAVPFGGQPEKYSILLRPATWVSTEVTDFVRSHPHEQPAMVPLETLFAEHPPAATESEDYARWRSEAALFLRWILEDGRPARRAALWKWVERGSAGPVDQAAFRECFGTSYVIVENELLGYLHDAVKTSITLRPDHQPENQPVELRAAKADEISRIKGDFNRLEIAYVRELCPELTGKYVQQARRTLGAAYEAGDRDPRLLAELGLCECDVSNDAGALPFLEAAVAAGVVRPRAYYELARIRFAALRAADPSGALSAAQVDGVLRPLFAARRQSPALPEAYELMAEVWLRSEATPGDEQLAILHDGTRLFPRRPRLLLSTALVYAAHGHVAEAKALVAHGLKVSTDASVTARLEKLQAAMAGMPAQ